MARYGGERVEPGLYLGLVTLADHAAGEATPRPQLSE